MRPFARFLSTAVATLLLVAPMLSSQPAPRTLVWAVDGLSFEAFTAAQQQGLFRRFAYAGRHVAPFPSMSHPAWTDITGADRLFGNRGRLRSVEANWFDLETMRVADDPRQVFARQAGPFNYMRSFDWFFDPIIEPLMYFEGDRLADRELAEAERDVLERFSGDHHVVFLGAADAIAHTHLGGLHPYLQRLDAMMTRVADSLAARCGAPVRQFILSDHGNVGAFTEGRTEHRLTPVSLDAPLRRAGLVKRDTGQLTAANDVSIVTLALASMVNVYFADLGRRRAFANEALRHPGVDVVTWLEADDHDRHVVIVSADRGEAHVRWQEDGAIAYTMISGNPLQLPDSVISQRGTTRWIADSVMRAVSMPGPYPDAPFRLVRSARKAVENAPDLVVSLRDGYCWAGSLGKYVKMVRTHGALGARSTLGLVASTHTPVPAYVRSHEVLAVTGLTERGIFHAALAHAPHDALAVVDSLWAMPRVIPTGRDEDTPDARFLRQVKPITLSAEYFDFDVLRAMAAAARADSVQRTTQRRRLDRTRSALRRSRAVDGVSRHTDTLLALLDPPPQSLHADSLSHLLDRVEARLRTLPELAPLAGLRRIWSGDSTAGAAIQAAGPLLRRGAMTAWTVPYYLDAVLDAPETDSVADPRDLAFARTWHATHRNRVRALPSTLLGDSTMPRQLFREVLAERTLIRRVEGATVPTLYDAALPEVTVVYVPGIFGELFDDEIWRRGLRSVRERLGVRVIPAGTDGRCSAADNATRLLQQLRDDSRRRMMRGYGVPRYVIVGYSKGGVDAAQALVRDTAFAVRQVAALVTIATPHGGSPVAERADIPDVLMRGVVAPPRPASCDTTRAVESLWPATRAAFWGSEGRRLGDLVPLYSLSLVSDMREAHPWMKITKRIARFTEENDGVVSRSASRFPAGIPSVHLGDVAGDHIAARSASAFPQESVLESLLLTLNELGAFEERAADNWRLAVADRRAVLALSGSGSGGDNGGDVPMPATTPPTRRPRQVLPGGTSAWRANRTFRMNNVEALADGTVAEATRERLPLGIDMRCDQADMTAFREEYEFLYDAGNGGSENNTENGFAMVGADTESGRACRLHTRRSAMKMTTVAFRFAPQEFPDFTMRLRVDRAVKGVAPNKGGRGRNDASIKIWYVLRDERPASKGKRLLFGYTWAGADADGNVPASDSLVEAGASRRRIAFSVLPEAWLVNIGGPTADGTWTEITRDFAADVRRAYPGIPLESLRVIAITVQSDSDDSKSETDVLLDRLAMTARRP